MKEKLRNAVSSIDWGQVVTLVVATMVIGAIVYGFQKANLTQLAKIAKGGR